MKEMRNCCNCGAPLKFNENNYESSVKCQYCRTEYHIDRLGKIEEYKVKLMIRGKIHEFYLSEFRVNNIYSDCYRNSNGKLIANKTSEKMEISLIEM